MTALVVEACGPATSVQDAGRFGFRRFGVATAGAMDRLALAVANVLAGNPPLAAAVECGLSGARFRVEGGAAVLAAAGPGVVLSVDGAAVPPGRGVRAAAGATVTLSPPRGGVWGYLALGGGLAAAPVMGSRSMHRRSGVGGAALRPGDRLELAGQGGRPMALPSPPEHVAGPFRVIPGPQDDAFAPAAMAALLGQPFTVSPRSDRMALRLDGPRLLHRAGWNIVSDGVVPGAIQVPGDGQPLVLMRDCQTTGGYPKIACVITADLDRLAQLPPGAGLRFAAVAPEAALAAARAAAAGLAALAAAARPAEALPAPPDLLALNLVDGVVDARNPPGAG